MQLYYVIYITYGSSQGIHTDGYFCVGCCHIFIWQMKREEFRAPD